FSSRRRHTRCLSDWSSDVCSSDLDENTALADYVGRMQSGQDKIYYVVGETLAAARSHPAIEGLRARNVEVLLLGRRIDAWVMDRSEERRVGKECRCGVWVWWVRKR